MRPPIVDQTDCFDRAYRDDVRAATGISCTAEEDRARQEFKNECDVNWLLRKYGALPPSQTFPQGEVDFDLSLLDAKMALGDARKAYEAFPRVLREKLSFEGFLTAVANGSFRMAPLPPKEAPAGSSAGADAGSQA